MNLIQAHKHFFNANRDGLLYRGRVEEAASYCNISDKHSMSPLALACINGNVSNVAELLKIPNIDVSIRDRLGRTPFILTVLSDSALDMYEEETRLDMLTRTEFEEMKMAYVKTNSFPAATAYIQILDLLLQHIAEEDVEDNLTVYGNHAFNWAIKARKSLELVHFLLGNNKIRLTSSQINTAIYDSIANSTNCTQFLEVLITQNHYPIDLNFIQEEGDMEDCSPLGHAIARQCVDCVKLLITHPSVNTETCGQHEYNCSPAMHCLSVMSEEAEEAEEKLTNNDVIKLLMEHPSINVNCAQVGQGAEQRSEAVIHRLIWDSGISAQYDLLKLLLQRPELNPNLKMNSLAGISSGFGTLELACMCQRYKLIPLLLADKRIHVNNTQDADQAEDQHEHILSAAIMYATPNVVELYLKAGANPKATTWETITESRMDMFWYNALQSDNDTTKTEFNRRFKIGQMLIDAGARPVMNQIVHAHLIQQANSMNLQNPIRKRRMKKVLEKLEALCFSRCPSLAEISRGNLYDQMRLISGPFPTTHLCEDLLKTVNIPRTLHKFVKLEQLQQQRI